MITTNEILTSEVRALSIKQPFADLMLPPHEKQETRTWPTDYRGLVLICASSQPYGDRELVKICGPEQYARILQTLGPKWFNQVKRGNAIAVGRLIKCVPGSVEPAPSVFSHFTYVLPSPDLYVHLFDDVTPIKPFPWRGQLGYVSLTQEQKELIKPL